jgi:hypothetical protein
VGYFRRSQATEKTKKPPVARKENGRQKINSQTEDRAGYNLLVTIRKPTPVGLAG